MVQSIGHHSGSDASEDEGGVWVPGGVLGAVEHPAPGQRVGTPPRHVAVVDIPGGGAATVAHQPAWARAGHERC